MVRDWSFRRHHRRRVIHRKMRVVKAGLWFVRHQGMLDKGKTHCSCWMCRQKSYDHLSQADLRKQVSAQQEVAEFLIQRTD